LYEHRDIDREYSGAARALPAMRGVHFASNDMTALYYAYYKGAKFYGLPQGTTEAVAQQFRQYRIELYFLIGSAQMPPPYLREADRIDLGKIDNLRVYKVATNHP
jgi:hypothetical protein